MTNGKWNLPLDPPFDDDMAKEIMDFGKEVGVNMSAAGGLSEKRVIRYASRYLAIAPDEVLLQPLTPDASTRKYYRISKSSRPHDTLIVSLYATPFNPQDNSFLDASRLFERAGLPVPKIIDVAGTEGVILQEDLGDVSLTGWLIERSGKGESDSVDRKLRAAIDLICHIQAATETAIATDSMAAGLAFDFDKLSWELNYFFDHYFGSYKRHDFTARGKEEIMRDLHDISLELASRPRVLTHRDYHGMNLMVDGNDMLRVIDHQDARMGPVTYDLVPLLVERRLEPVDEKWVEGYQDYFLKVRGELDLDPVSTEDLRYEFDLMTIQRQLKAIGTFSYQTAVVGRSEAYEKYIEPAKNTVLRAMNRTSIKEYPALRKALERI